MYNYFYDVIDGEISAAEGLEHIQEHLLKIQKSDPMCVSKDLHNRAVELNKQKKQIIEFLND